MVDAETASKPEHASQPVGGENGPGVAYMSRAQWQAC